MASKTDGNESSTVVESRFNVMHAGATEGSWVVALVVQRVNMPCPVKSKSPKYFALLLVHKLSNIWNSIHLPRVHEAVDSPEVRDTPAGGDERLNYITHISLSPSAIQYDLLGQRHGPKEVKVRKVAIHWQSTSCPEVAQGNLHDGGNDTRNCCPLRVMDKLFPLRVNLM